MSSVIPIFHTSQIKARLVQHCAVETPLLRAQSKALVAATGNPSLGRSALAECLPIYEERARAATHKFEKETRKLLKTSTQVGRLQEKAAHPTSGPARKWAIADLEKSNTSRKEALLQSMLMDEQEGVDATLRAARLYEKNLIEKYGDSHSVTLGPLGAAARGINAHHPESMTRHYNEQLFWHYKTATQLDQSIELGRARVKEAQEAFAQSPSPETQKMLTDLATQHSQNLDKRSYAWMQTKWLAELRDQNIRQATWGWVSSFLDKAPRSISK